MTQRGGHKRRGVMSMECSQCGGHTERCDVNAVFYKMYTEQRGDVNGVCYERQRGEEVKTTNYFAN